MKTSHILQQYYLFLYIEREIETCLDAQISLSIIYSTMRNKHHDMRLYFFSKVINFSRKPSLQTKVYGRFIQSFRTFATIICYTN